MSAIDLLHGPRPTAKLRRFTIAIAVALAAAVGLQFVQLCRGPRGDFPNHWEFGRRMAAGEMIYARGLNVVYPPLWSLIHAPLTVLPAHAAQLVVFPLFIVALATLLWTLRHLTAGRFAANSESAWLPPPWPCCWRGVSFFAIWSSAVRTWHLWR